MVIDFNDDEMSCINVGSLSKASNNLNYVENFVEKWGKSDLPSMVIWLHMCALLVFLSSWLKNSRNAWAPMAIVIRVIVISHYTKRNLRKFTHLVEKVLTKASKISEHPMLCCLISTLCIICNFSTIWKSNFRLHEWPKFREILETRCELMTTFTLFDAKNLNNRI